MKDINHGIIKQVKSLARKKERDDAGLFVAEGTKCVRDTWDAFECEMLIATRAWYEQRGTAQHYDRLVLAGKADMERMSQFSTAPEVIAVYRIPNREPDYAAAREGLSLVLDGVQDPGNLGTIIRLADWYGIRQLFAGNGTVDVYNHKVVQATMGAIARVAVHYVDLEDLFERVDVAKCGTLLDGENIYNASLPAQALIVLGNEGQGISREVAALLDRRLTIPASPRCGSESLNVGMAAAVVLSEFCRESLKTQ